MNGERVLLMELRERTSAKGNRYLAGWLGRASVVAFLDRNAETPTWQLFVSAPAQRPDNGQPEQSTPPRSHRPSRRRATELQPGELDDPVDDLGRN